MAKPTPIEKVKNFINYQYYDEEQWALNSKLLKTFGFFATSILLMRNFGEFIAV